MSKFKNKVMVSYMLFFLTLAKVMNCPQVCVQPFTFSYKKEYVQWFFIAVSSESKSICSVSPPVKKEMKPEWTSAIIDK